MTYTPIAPGTLTWGVPVNAAFVDQDTRITANTATNVTQDSRLTLIEGNEQLQAPDAGWIAWNYDPALGQGSTGLVTGQLYMARIDVMTATTAINAIYAVMTAGSTLTSGQNLVGLYNSTGTLLASSADQSASWTSTGLKVTPFVSSVPIPAGTYHLGFLSNGTTPMSLLRSLGSAAQAATINLNLSVSTARWATSGSGLTALPPSVTMSGRALAGGATWGALS